MVSSSVIVKILLLTGLLGPFSLAFNILQSSNASSWNSAVSCQPVQVTVRNILGSKTSANGGALYSTGWNASVPDKRSTSPPCTVNGKGMLVEIHNVTLLWLDSSSDCGNAWSNPPVPNSYCDSSGNIQDRNDHGFDPNLNMTMLHVENDMNWKYHNQAFPNPPTNKSIDVQGFVYWDSDHTGSLWHSYSGWELHPLTAWRTAQSSPSNPPNSQPNNCYWCPLTVVVTTNLWLLATVGLVGFTLILSALHRGKPRENLFTCTRKSYTTYH